MSKWNVTLKATIEVDDPQTLDQLIIARLYEDKSGEECVEIGSKFTASMQGDYVSEKEQPKSIEFELIEYPKDWLDFTEVIE